MPRRENTIEGIINYSLKTLLIKENARYCNRLTFGSHKPELRVQVPSAQQQF